MYFIESVYSIKGIYKFVIPPVSVSFNTKFTVGFAGFPFGFRLLSESVQVACGKWQVVTALAAITASGTSCQLQLKSCSSSPSPPFPTSPKESLTLKQTVKAANCKKKEEKKERKWRMTHSSKLQWKIRKFNEGIRENPKQTKSLTLPLAK